ncbi:MAG: hypothetical protein WCO52_06045 [bacterium]
MGLATHLGPWLLGTVKNTTGSTAGLIRNTGATVVTQTASYTTPAGVSAAAPYTGVTTAIAVLPAGAVIHDIIVDVITAFVGATAATTLTVQTGNATLGLSSNFAAATQLAQISATSTVAAGRTTMSPNTTNIALWSNVGTSDLIVQLIFATAGNYTSGGTANIQIAYTVRNADGTAAPTYAQA